MAFDILSLCGLCSLKALHLSCGQMASGLQMGYDRALFGLPTFRCRALAQFLCRSQTLTHLDLSCNLMDDTKAGLLTEGLSRSLSVTCLDLHSNRVAPILFAIDLLDE